MKQVVFKITKGKSIKDRFGIFSRDLLPPDYKLNTDYDSLKINRTDRLFIDLPSETIGAGSDKTYTHTYKHNLLYVPYYEPKVNGQPIGGVPPVDDVNLNEGSEALPPVAYGGDPQGDIVTIYVTNTEIVLSVLRYSSIFPWSAPAYQVYADFTLYHNRIDEEVDYSKN